MACKVIQWAISTRLCVVALSKDVMQSHYEATHRLADGQWAHTLIVCGYHRMCMPHSTSSALIRYDNGNVMCLLMHGICLSTTGGGWDHYTLYHNCVGVVVYYLTSVGQNVRLEASILAYFDYGTTRRGRCYNLSILGPPYLASSAVTISCPYLTTSLYSMYTHIPHSCCHVIIM